MGVPAWVVYALIAILPQGIAIVVTLASRLWMTLGELLAVGAVALVVRVRRGTTPSASSGEAADRCV